MSASGFAGSGDIRSNSIKSADVSRLRASDFTGSLPKGSEGSAGPAGPRGPAGATNVVMRRGASATILAGLVSNAIADCNVGERAVGGGATWEETSTVQMPILQSNPHFSGGSTDGAVPTGWAVSAANSTATDKHLRAWVVCASP